MSGVTVVCFLASYIVALGLEWLRLVRRTAISRFVMLGFAAAGLVAHTIYLVERSRQTNLPPLLSSTHDWLLIVAWVAVVLYLFVTTFDRDLAVGPFLLPLVLALVVASRFVSDAPIRAMAGASEAARHNWAMLHAAFLVFGIAGVLVGLVLSMMYVVQHWRLKHRQLLRNGLTLPNLERLARLNWWAIILSVPLLTLGLGTGFILGLLTRDDDFRLTFGDPVILGNLAVWGVMAALFAWLAFSSRPPGKQVAWTTIWACGFLLVTMVSLQVLAGEGPLSLETWH